MSDGLVIIGYDGSETADHAIREAGRALGPRNALVVVVWEAGAAYESFEAATYPGAAVDLPAAAAIDEALYEGARNTATRGVAAATEAGFRAEGVVTADERSVATTLAHLASERGAAMVVVGARGHSRVERLFVGSTSRSILESSPCPVLVVPAVRD
ncbi:MAG: universal stress protein [Thermoleophilia bacterium]